MYQPRLQVRLLEHSLENEAALVYEGAWLSVPEVGHEVLISAGSAGRSLWKVNGVRHIVGVDGRCLRSDLEVSRID